VDGLGAPENAKAKNLKKIRTSADNGCDHRRPPT